MTSSKIVTGFVSMWPREVCDLRAKDENRLFIRFYEPLKKPGVYVLYRDEHPYYIGRAKLLSKRIFAHANKTTDRYYNFWNMFSVFVVADAKYIADVERILIAAMPTANSSTPRMTKIGLPNYIVRQVREIRKHQANPVTKKELVALLKAAAASA